MSDSEDLFRPVTVLDVEIKFHNPTAIQASMMHRLSKVIDVAFKVSEDETLPKERQKQAAGQVLDSMGKLLDIIGSLAPESEREWLADMMLTGKLSDEALLKMLDDLLPTEGEAPAPKAGPNPKRVKRV